ncbi:hypothetical protein ACFO9Q_21620 [Paenibacillus sp. GCM10023252]|uniref:hypothetical protein n=1 Tax=Paenibacillus sp. GCM10023252 TaxID=3252649 RepID=UPI0036226AD8
MPNQSIFHNSNQFLYSDATNTYTSPETIAPPTQDASVNGLSYMASASNTGSLGILGGTIIVSLQLSNPAASGRRLYITSFEGSIDISLSVLSSFSGTSAIVSGGSLSLPAAVTARNLRLGSSTASVVTARSSISAVSGGTTFMTYPLQPASFRLEYPSSIIVPEGQAVTLTVSGSLSILGSLSTYASITWWEAAV